MLNIGIIGLGVGESHVQGYLAHPGCRVIALCDFDDKIYNIALQKYPDYRITKDANEILNNPEIDVVSIASWDNYHFEQITKGISNNKHLFVEKPVVLFEDEAIEVIKLIKQKSHLKISSNLILRKAERFSELKKMVQEKKLGELSYIMGGYNYGRLNKITEGWRGKIDFYSIVYGGGVHLIDLIMWISGDIITEVSAFGNNIQTLNTDFKYNDLIVSILKFSNGLVGTLSCNFGCVYPHFHQFEVYGTKATFVNDFEFAKIFKCRDSKDFNKNHLLQSAEFKQHENIEHVFTEYKNTHKGEHIYNFIESIIQDKEPDVSLKEIFNTMSVCFAIEKSMKNNSVEKVNYLY